MIQFIYKEVKTLEISERLKIIRNDLKMSQESFGETIGVSRDVINNLERGRVEPKEYILRLICKTHRINYFWLTEEIGDIYISPPEILMDEVVNEYNLDGLDKVIVEEYVKLSPEARTIVKKLIKNIIKNAPD